MILGYMIFNDPRTWVFYYLISFVALLWVGFLAVQGVMLYIGLFVTLVVLGFSVILCIMVIMEMRQDNRIEIEGRHL
jgi:hypothetical protein